MPEPVVTFTEVQLENFVRTIMTSRLSAVRDLEWKLGKSMAMFVKYEEWKGYKDGVQDVMREVELMQDGVDTYADAVREAMFKNVSLR